jgi:GrpB-like predicted nucleotidyltransferase (UPF0157 family)
VQCNHPTGYASKAAGVSGYSIKIARVFGYACRFAGDNTLGITRNTRSRVAVIQIVPYTPAWTVAFKSEGASLRRALGAQVIRIDHVGSTAVPGLAAKPVIDIQVSVLSLEPLEPFQAALAPLGYKFVSLGEFDRAYPWFAKPGKWPSTHHVHLCVAGKEEEAKHLAFRDYLRQNPEQAQRYEALKRSLAGEYDGTTLSSVESYSLAKSEFIKNALASAGIA